MVFSPSRLATIPIHAFLPARWQCLHAPPPALAGRDESRRSKIANQIKFIWFSLAERFSVVPRYLHKLPAHAGLSQSHSRQARSAPPADSSARSDRPRSLPRTARCRRLVAVVQPRLAIELRTSSPCRVRTRASASTATFCPANTTDSPIAWPQRKQLGRRIRLVARPDPPHSLRPRSPPG